MYVHSVLAPPELLPNRFLPFKSKLRQKARNFPLPTFSNLSRGTSSQPHTGTVLDVNACYPILVSTFYVFRQQITSSRDTASAPQPASRTLKTIVARASTLTLRQDKFSSFGSRIISQYVRFLFMTVPTQMLTSSLDLRVSNTTRLSHETFPSVGRLQPLDREETPA